MTVGAALLAVSQLLTPFPRTPPAYGSSALTHPTSQYSTPTNLYPPIQPCTPSQCLDAEFFLQIADALKENRSLTALDVGGNNIGPQGAIAIAGALKGNDVLKTLELGYNPIGAEGAQAFGESIKYDTPKVGHVAIFALVGQGVGA